MTTYTGEALAAYQLGVQAAEAAASWTTDGNTSEDHVRRVLAMIEDGDPRADEFLPAMPNLSGEWADEMTPRQLAQEVFGEDAPDAAILEGLCDAWEAGVADTFEPACEAELRKAVA